MNTLQTGDMKQLPRQIRFYLSYVLQASHISYIGSHTHTYERKKALNIFFCLLSSLQSLHCLSAPLKFPWKQEVVSPRTETVTALCRAVLISALMTFSNNFSSSPQVGDTYSERYRIPAPSALGFFRKEPSERTEKWPKCTSSLYGKICFGFFFSLLLIYQCFHLESCSPFA